MVMERLEVAQKHPDNQTPEKQEAIARAKAALLEAEVVDPGPKQADGRSARRTTRPESKKVYPKISQEEEFERQVINAVERIAKPLGISEQAALASLPKKFPDRLAEYDGLDISTPLIVPRFRGFSWLQHVEAAGLGVSDYLRSRISELSQWQDPREEIEMPDVSYAGWFHTGDRYKGRPIDVRARLQGVEVADDHWGGAGLATLRVDIVKVRLFGLIGGQVGAGGLPCVGWWGGRPGFDAGWDDDPDYRALVRGSKIELGS